MNWNEYKTLAIRTESVPVITFEKVPYNMQHGEKGDMLSAYKDATRLLHATMGVCTELAELVDGNGVVNFVEEVGDVLWYLAIADDVIGFHSRGNVYKNKPPIYWLGELNDVLKRHLFYGAELNVERLVMAFIHIYQDVYSELANHSFTIEMAMEANIRKLEKRFPEKMFTAQAAIHRDVDRELDHILANGELVPRVETSLELEPAVLVDSLGASDWASLVGKHLTASQLSTMARDLCFARAGSLRAVGAILEARAYDEMYRMCGGLDNLLEDTSMYNIWITLGYSLIRKDVVERLERWK